MSLTFTVTVIVWSWRAWLCVISAVLLRRDAIAVVEVVSLLKDVFVSSTNAVAHGVDCVGRATTFSQARRLASSF